MEKNKMLNDLKANILDNPKVVMSLYTLMLIAVACWVILRATQFATSVMPVPKQVGIILWTILAFSIWGFISINLANMLFSIKKIRSDFLLLLSWILSIALLIIPFTLLFSGMKIGATGIVAALSGFEETAKNSGYAMTKFHPFHPFTPIALAFEFFSGRIVSSNNLISVGTGLNLVTAASISAMSSTACMILKRGKGLAVWTAIIAAASVILIISKTGLQLDLDLGIGLYGVVLLLLWGQLFIWSDYLNRKAHSTGVESSVKNHQPSIKQLLFCTFIAAPILADASVYSDILLK